MPGTTSEMTTDSTAPNGAVKSVANGTGERAKTGIKVIVVGAGKPQSYSRSARMHS